MFSRSIKTQTGHISIRICVIKKIMVVMAAGPVYYRNLFYSFELSNVFCIVKKGKEVEHFQWQKIV